MLAELPVRSLRDRVLLLRAFDSLGSLDDDALALLAESSQERQFTSGDYLARSGEELTKLYLVIRGSVEVTRLGKRLATVGPGRGVGFLTAISGDEHGIDAVALEDTVAFEIGIERVRSAFEQNFSFIRNSLRLIATELLKDRRGLPRRPEDAPEPEVGAYPIRPPTLVERIIDIAELPLFKQANIDAVIDLARRTEQVRFQPGETIWSAGAPADHILRLEYGVVECTSEAGETVRVGAGFVIGVLDTYAHLPRPYTAVATTEIVGWRTQASVMLGILDSHRELAFAFLALLARQMLEQQAGKGPPEN